MGSSFKCACIRHLALKGAALRGITAPLGSANQYHSSGD